MAIGSTRLNERIRTAASQAAVSQAAGIQPAWARWILPSASDLIFVALLSLLVFTALSVRLLGDAGIGWHIRTGQLILATHQVPRVDPFSSASAPSQWFAWEWLYDVVVGWLESAAGLNAVVLFTAILLATVFAWTFRLLLRRGTNVFVGLMLVLLAASAAMIHFLARPHVVSWLFTLAWFCILESSEKTSSVAPHGRRVQILWLLPLLMLVWVNLHGGFLVGFALLAIYWLGAAWQWFSLKDDGFDQALEKIRAGRRMRDLALIGILSAAATLVNPYGFHLHVHIYRYLSDRFLMDHIDEFQSPNFHYVAQKCFAALLLLTLVALVAKKRHSSAIRMSQTLVVLFAVFSGLYSSRNIPVSSLLLILIIGPWLSKAMAGLADLLTARTRAPAQFLHRMQTIELSLRGHLWPIAATLLCCWIAVHGGKLGPTAVMNAHFDSKRFPVQAVNALEQQHVPGPILSPDYWGGYLIYRLYPRLRAVVVDDRHDLYGDDFLKSYLTMVHVEPGWQDFLRQHQPRCVLVPKVSALANILTETSGWMPIYTDDVAVAFVQAPEPAGK
jgi:hypothetical protein